MTETISAAARIAMSHSEEISPDQAGYEIRPAQVADLPQLQELVDRFVQANRLLPRTADELHDLVPSGFVAIAEGHVVGFAALEIYSPKLAEIRSLAVDPGYHGRGIGRGLVSRCVQLAVSRKVLEVMSEAVNVIAEGEVLQLMNVNDPDITEENYMRVIYSKTARLFEAAAQCSGILAGCTPEEEKGLQDYGRYLGTAFQLIDDLLDYNADGEQLGKNVGDDLNEGKPTVPLLHAMHHGTPEQAQMIRTAIEQGNGRHLLEPVLEAMNACGSLEWTRQRAEEEADKAIAALQVLPDTPWREALIGLAHIAVQRDR